MTINFSLRFLFLLATNNRTVIKISWETWKIRDQVEIIFINIRILSSEIFVLLCLIINFFTFLKKFLRSTIKIFNRNYIFHLPNKSARFIIISSIIFEEKIWDETTMFSYLFSQNIFNVSWQDFSPSFNTQLKLYLLSQMLLIYLQ